MEASKDFLSGVFLGSLLLFSSWMAIQKVRQLQLSGKVQTLCLIFILGLKLPLYIWIIIEGTHFSYFFWMGWGITYLLLCSWIFVRSLIQVQINKK